MGLSKISKTKNEQGWRKKCPNCANCKSFTMDVEKIVGRYGTFEKEKNKRCSIGGFAVGKSNWCEKHEFD